MKAGPYEEAGPSIGHRQARAGAVKTPHAVRPRRGRADGLDRANDAPRSASVGGPSLPWPQPWTLGELRGREAAVTPSNAASILVTIGQQTRIFHAYVTAAPAQLDAPSTMTLYSSTLAHLAMFADAEFMVEPEKAQRSARLVLVDAMELTWQRARCRESGHRLVPADAWFVGPPTLQRWLWRRLFAVSYDEVTSHGTDTSSR